DYADNRRPLNSRTPGDETSADIQFPSTPVAKRFHQQGKGGGRLPATGVVQVVAGEGWTPVLEHSHQTSFFEMRRELRVREVGNAHPADRGIGDMGCGV